MNMGGTSAEKFSYCSYRSPDGIPYQGPMLGDLSAEAPVPILSPGKPSSGSLIHIRRHPKSSIHEPQP